MEKDIKRILSKLTQKQIEDSITVINYVIENFKFEHEGKGLCYYFNGNKPRLFTLKLAIKYGNANPESEESYFWWPTCINLEDAITIGPKQVNDERFFDKENRIKFLNWMLEQYKLMLK